MEYKVDDEFNSFAIYDNLANVKNPSGYNVCGRIEHKSNEQCKYFPLPQTGLKRSDVMHVVTSSSGESTGDSVCLNMKEAAAAWDHVISQAEEDVDWRADPAYQEVRDAIDDLLQDWDRSKTSEEAAFTSAGASRNHLTDAANYDQRPSDCFFDGNAADSYCQTAINHNCRPLASDCSTVMNSCVTATSPARSALNIDETQSGEDAHFAAARSPRTQSPSVAQLRLRRTPTAHSGPNEQPTIYENLLGCDYVSHWGAAYDKQVSDAQLLQVHESESPASWRPDSPRSLQVNRYPMTSFRTNDSASQSSAVSSTRNSADFSSSFESLSPASKKGILIRRSSPSVSSQCSSSERQVRFSDDELETTGSRSQDDSSTKLELLKTRRCTSLEPAAGSYNVEEYEPSLSTITVTSVDDRQYREQPRAAGRKKSKMEKKIISSALLDYFPKTYRSNLQAASDGQSENSCSLPELFVCEAETFEPQAKLTNTGNYDNIANYTEPIYDNVNNLDRGMSPEDSVDHVLEAMVTSDYESSDLSDNQADASVAPSGGNNETESRFSMTQSAERTKSGVQENMRQKTSENKEVIYSTYMSPTTNSEECFVTTPKKKVDKENHASPQSNSPLQTSAQASNKRETKVNLIIKESQVVKQQQNQSSPSQQSPQSSHFSNDSDLSAILVPISPSLHVDQMLESIRTATGSDKNIPIQPRFQKQSLFQFCPERVVDEVLEGLENSYSTDDLENTGRAFGKHRLVIPPKTKPSKHRDVSPETVFEQIVEKMAVPPDVVPKQPRKKIPPPVPPRRGSSAKHYDFANARLRAAKTSSEEVLLDSSGTLDSFHPLSSPSAAGDTSVESVSDELSSSSAQKRSSTHKDDPGPQFVLKMDGKFEDKIQAKNNFAYQYPPYTEDEIETELDSEEDLDQFKVSPQNGGAQGMTQQIKNQYVRYKKFQSKVHETYEGVMDEFKLTVSPNLTRCYQNALKPANMDANKQPILKPSSKIVIEARSNGHQKLSKIENGKENVLRNNVASTTATVSNDNRINVTTQTKNLLKENITKSDESIETACKRSDNSCDNSEDSTPSQKPLLKIRMCFKHTPAALPPSNVMMETSFLNRNPNALHPEIDYTPRLDDGGEHNANKTYNEHNAPTADKTPESKRSSKSDARSNDNDKQDQLAAEIIDESKESLRLTSSVNDVSSEIRANTDSANDASSLHQIETNANSNDNEETATNLQASNKPIEESIYVVTDDEATRRSIEDLYYSYATSDSNGSTLTRPFADALNEEMEYLSKIEAREEELFLQPQEPITLQHSPCITKHSIDNDEDIAQNPTALHNAPVRHKEEDMENIHEDRYDDVTVAQCTRNDVSLHVVLLQSVYLEDPVLTLKQARFQKVREGPRSCPQRVLITSLCACLPGVMVMSRDRAVWSIVSSTLEEEARVSAADFDVLFLKQPLFVPEVTELRSIDFLELPHGDLQFGLESSVLLAFTKASFACSVAVLTYIEPQKPKYADEFLECKDYCCVDALSDVDERYIDDLTFVGDYNDNLELLVVTDDEHQVIYDERCTRTIKFNKYSPVPLRKKKPRKSPNFIAAESLLKRTKNNPILSITEIVNVPIESLLLIGRCCWKNRIALTQTVPTTRLRKASRHKMAVWFRKRAFINKLPNQTLLLEIQDLLFHTPCLKYQVLSAVEPSYSKRLILRECKKNAQVQINYTNSDSSAQRFLEQAVDTKLVVAKLTLARPLPKCIARCEHKLTIWTAFIPAKDIDLTSIESLTNIAKISNTSSTITPLKLYNIVEVNSELYLLSMEQIVPQIASNHEQCIGPPVVGNIAFVMVCHLRKPIGIRILNAKEERKTDKLKTEHIDYASLYDTVRIPFKIHLSGRKLIAPSAVKVLRTIHLGDNCYERREKLRHIPRARSRPTETHHHTGKPKVETSSHYGALSAETDVTKSLQLLKNEVILTADKSDGQKAATSCQEFHTDSQLSNRQLRDLVSDLADAQLAAVDRPSELEQQMAIDLKGGESDRGSEEEVLNEETSTCSVTITYLWPKPAHVALHSGPEPYRELFLHRVSRISDCEATVLEGPSVRAVEPAAHVCDAERT